MLPFESAHLIDGVDLCRDHVEANEDLQFIEKRVLEQQCADKPASGLSAFTAQVASGNDASQDQQDEHDGDDDERRR